MKNPFHEIDQLIKNEPADFQDAVHALISTMLLQCCEQCNSNLHSDEFLRMFQQMLQQMKLCRSLLNRSAA